MMRVLIVILLKRGARGFCDIVDADDDDSYDADEMALMMVSG